MQTLKEIMITALIGFCWVAMIIGFGWVALGIGAGLTSTPAEALADGGAAMQQGVQLAEGGLVKLGLLA